MIKNHSFLIFLSLLLISCDAINVKETDCQCEEIQVTKEESIKCEAFPEEEEEISQYGLLKKTEWQAVDSIIDRDHLSLAWPAWLQSCNALVKKQVWTEVCKASRLLMNPSDSEIKQFFYHHFFLYQALQNSGKEEGLITGYYQPLLKGSRKKTGKHQVPLYAPPSDLVIVDLSEIYPDLKYKRLRGRLEGNKLIPYLTREEISENAYPLKGQELLWVNDPVEAFFLEIQGSGVIAFEDGSRTQVGYADQNGHPYRSMGRELIHKGELSRHKVSMQSIKAWAKKNKAKLQKFMNANPSVVFFRELPPGLPGPIGALGVPITAERSVAVDRRFIPLGAPIVLSTTQPYSDKPLEQLMVAQDTGGAIGGGVRVDYYWGQGDYAGKKAGSMKQQGKVWVLLPKTFIFPDSK
ncbi:MAG: murein transglycosylase [Nitrosomonadales bacterium]|uniref:peptidoglycan lytic exotransglycosylase n=1 Tax=Methylophilales bacterium HTCC2181 TaxID=383631 RepID=A0P549_9PROT|nr:MltA [Methylophilales bacterium HTCC2181]MBT5410658.1 murein transglycosylase [Nitrosomonadales bacterium]MBT6140785.1 murein transglycosylase [Nitrosomonadales bacterium]MDC1281282.1 MltA domain-containing protein [Methylophilaceae bacterium]